MITLSNVTGGYNSSTEVVRNLSFTVAKGQFFALLGPNGSGKTTIIRLLMGALNLHSGSIKIEGTDVRSYKPRQLAQKVAVMTQENEVGLDFTVKEIVALGRYPYQKSFLFKENTIQDDDIVEKVMQQTNVWQFRDKLFTTLSGGEKQRVLLAKALAQEPDVLLLDEPTNHLDIRHTMELLDLLKQLQLETNMTILAILHDLNLASLYADTVGLLSEGKLQGIYAGFLRENESTFSKVYEVKMNFRTHPEVAKKQMFISPKFLINKQQKTLKDSLTVCETPNQVKLEFCQPFRTLSLGNKGKGITWENAWSFAKQSNRTKVIEDSSLCHFEGEMIAFGYNNVTDSCESFEFNKFNYSWSNLIFVGREQGGLRLGIISKNEFTELQLMNLSVHITALTTELDLQKGLSQIPIKQLVISCCTNDSEHVKQDTENTIREISRLIHHSWNFMENIKTIRKFD